jgi:hypothetical protein
MRKFVVFWNDYERANVENLSFHRRFPGVLSLPLLTYGFIAPLALMGVFLSRMRWRELWLLYGGIIAYLVAALAFYVLARYRLPVVGFLLPFAGAGVAELVTLVQNRRTAVTVPVLAVLAVLFYCVNLTVAVDTPFGISANLTRLGNAWIARGDTTRAVQAYREALEQHPKNAAAAEGLERLQSR